LTRKASNILLARRNYFHQRRSLKRWSATSVANLATYLSNDVLQAKRRKRRSTTRMTQVMSQVKMTRRTRRKKRSNSRKSSSRRKVEPTLESG